MHAVAGLVEGAAEFLALVPWMAHQLNALDFGVQIQVASKVLMESFDLAVLAHELHPHEAVR